MRSVAKKSGTNKKRGQVVRATTANRPVSEGIGRAESESSTVTVVRGDLTFAVENISEAFNDVLAAQFTDDGGQHDVLVLNALRRLRMAQSAVECVTGGAL